MFIIQVLFAKLSCQKNVLFEVSADLEGKGKEKVERGSGGGNSGEGLLCRALATNLASKAFEITKDFQYDGYESLAGD